MTPPTPSVSILIVSDYAAGGPEGWKDIRKALTALAGQEFAEPVEYILCESDRFRDDVPSDLTAILPSLRLHFVPDLASYAIKNHGVSVASAEFVAVLDADCIPDAMWLRRLVSVLRAEPKAAVVSGRTIYPGGSLSERVCALLGRSYLDPGRAGETRFIAINNCAFRRVAYLESPLPSGLGTFSSHMQCEALKRAGWRLLFDPEIRVVHDFEGWSMEADFRRNCGHGTIRTRLEDPTLPHAWLARLGRPAILPILAGKLLDSWRDCIRCGRQYG
ncbi:MAG: glycosyltransferase, partial [Longimicrobiales bacterium]